MKDKIFFLGIFGFVFGVLFSSFFSVNNIFVCFGILVTVVLILVGVFYKNSRQVFILASIFTLAFSFGILRYYVNDTNISKNSLDNFLDKNISSHGFIVEDVENKINSQRFVIRVDKFSFQEKEYISDVKILVSTDIFPKYKYGDEVEIFGKLDKPENFITDTGKEFDYVNYLKKDKIFYTMSFVKIEVISTDNGHKIKALLLKIKNSFLGKIDSFLFPPESSLLSGLLLGVKSSLPENLQTAFINTGLVHVVVLSGYNVTIIAESLMKVVSFVTVSLGAYLGVLVIVLFAIMTGAGSTIVRASIMAILALFARSTGRNYDIVRALIFAGFIMILFNPYILVYDISFELSFLATMGLIFMSPIFKEKFRFLPERFGLREIAGSTIGVQVFVLPFILYKMGNLSIIAPITNLIILPLIPTTMLFGFLAVVFSFISSVLATPFGFIVHLLLKFEIFVVEFSSRLPFATIHLRYFPFVLVLVFYSFVCFKLFHYYKKHNISS